MQPLQHADAPKAGAPLDTASHNADMGVPCVIAMWHNSLRCAVPTLEKISHSILDRFGLPLSHTPKYLSHLERVELGFDSHRPRVAHP